MGNQTALHRPYRVVPDSDTFELTIAEDNGVPTEGDGTVYNVLFAPLSGTRAVVNRYGPEVVMIEGYFTGAAKATADCQVGIWQFNELSEQWSGSNCVAIAGTALASGSLTRGSMGKAQTSPATRRGYLEVTGLLPDQAIVLTVTKVK